MIVYIVLYEDWAFSGVAYVANDRKMAQDYIDSQLDKDFYRYRIVEWVISQKDNRKPAEGVRCPHCGSSAQVRSSGVSLSDNGLVMTENFTCGCGCWFERDYERDTEGNWEFSWQSVNCVDPEMVK